MWNVRQPGMVQMYFLNYHWTIPACNMCLKVSLGVYNKSTQEVQAEKHKSKKHVNRSIQFSQIQDVSKWNSRRKNHQLAQLWMWLIENPICLKYVCSFSPFRRGGPEVVRGGPGVVPRWFGNLACADGFVLLWCPKAWKHQWRNKSCTIKTGAPRRKSDKGVK